jgi:hypothetical protein
MKAYAGDFLAILRPIPTKIMPVMLDTGDFKSQLKI